MSPFRPYAPEVHGDLEAYLNNCDGIIHENVFFGPEYFLVMQQKGLIIPGTTSVRVNRSPAPDFRYSVDSDFMLTSTGVGTSNMSVFNAPKGVYNPQKVLKKSLWSIYDLKPIS